MGIPAVILPVLTQFSSKKERLDNLNGVRDCLQLFHKKGYRHGDIYWRNIAYFKSKAEIIVIMLDLHPARVFKEDNDGSWIDEALDKLEKRASI